MDEGIGLVEQLEDISLSQLQEETEEEAKARCGNNTCSDSDSEWEESIEMDNESESDGECDMVINKKGDNHHLPTRLHEEPTQTTREIIALSLPVKVSTTNTNTALNSYR